MTTSILTPDSLLLGTSIATFVTGFVLGVYSVRGWVLVSPELADERRRNLHDPVESDESDVDVGGGGDGLVVPLDHAPNWANGLEADRRDGLRLRKQKQKQKQKPRPFENGEDGDDDDDDDDEEDEVEGIDSRGEEKGRGRKKKKKNNNNNKDGGGKGAGRKAAAEEANPRAPLVDIGDAAGGGGDDNEECKLVLVVRTDLGMTKGWLAPLPLPLHPLSNPPSPQPPHPPTTPPSTPTP